MPEPIVHDPTKQVDLTINTVAASQRVKYRIDQAIDAAVEELTLEGLNADDKFLFWQLVGNQLRFRYQAIEAAAFTNGGTPGNGTGGNGSNGSNGRR